MELQFLLPIVFLLSIISFLFIVPNFIVFLVRGRLLTKPSWWIMIEVWTIAFAPIVFLVIADVSQKNDCCSESAVFSPEHRIGIYVLIILCIAAYIISAFRKELYPPIPELFLNCLLILALVLNILFSFHFNSKEDGPIWWIFGNIPVIFLLLIILIQNQNLLKKQIDEWDSLERGKLGRISLWILGLKPIYKYPVLLIILLPFIVLLSVLLMLFGQKPDSLLRAFTDTYKHGFSQLDYMCENVNCGDHFLCSVGANGHKRLVRPIRLGNRNGKIIVCNRQLLISNAFEELLAEKHPSVHKLLRLNYNRIGNVIHKHYGIFKIKVISDTIYILMKPLEMVFLLILYTFDKKPESRIARQYLGSQQSIPSTMVVRKGNINLANGTKYFSESCRPHDPQ